MKVLKTIVATAVVVFATTSVAMAGVGQLTKAQDAQAVDKTRAQRTVELTDKHLARLDRPPVGQPRPRGAAHEDPRAPRRARARPGAAGRP